jgi:hypothetical protein
MIRNVWFVTLALLAGTATLAAPLDADAQVVVYGNAGAGVVTQQPQYVQQPQYAQPQYAQPQYAQQPAQQISDEPRLRLQFTGGAGLGFGTATALFLEGSIGIGAQINNLFAVYYRPRGTVGFYVDGPGGSGGVFYQIQNAVLADFTFLDMIQLAIGPSLDWGNGLVSNGSGSYYLEEVSFGIDSRIAVSVPSWTAVNGTRGGYTVELNTHLSLFAGQAIVQVGLAGGYIFY